MGTPAPQTPTGSPPLELPRSPTSQWINLAGLLVVAGVFVWLSGLTLPDGGSLPDLHLTLVCLLTLLIVVGALELGLLKIHLQPSTGLTFSNLPRHDAGRLGTKLLGAGATFGALGLCYWLFPEYQSGFYADGWRALRLAWPLLTGLVLVYFVFLDRRMLDPRDGYWQVGCLLLGRLHLVDKKILGQHVLGWLVKGFFTPMMFVFLLQVVHDLREFSFDRLDNIVGFYDLAFLIAICVDLVFTTAGYLFSFRALDSHIRSTESTLLGWMVAVICYRPIWDFFYEKYFQYQDNMTWDTWTAGSTLQVLWGCILIALLIVYAWATLTFGLRFSNLTHRGILINGPYRFTKHPAYISKNLSWWLIFIPFLPTRGWEDAVRHCLMLLGVNLIYFLRARTEERHLSKDPTYVAYALWMNEHGLLRWLGRVIPFLRYHPPAAVDRCSRAG